MNVYPCIRRWLFNRDPEWSHEFTLRHLSWLGRKPFQGLIRQQIVEKPVDCMGIRFPNPVGLAAGLDKNGACIDAFGAMGFGFIEVGTVTPEAQPGNPRPRMFRLPEHHAIINRMGFNNEGIDAFLNNVRKRSYKGVLGLNIGKNKSTPEEHAIDDYLYCLERVYPFADYVTVNISSPNTPGLRAFQHGSQFSDLLSALKKRQSELSSQFSRYVPIVIKIAPDMDKGQVQEIARLLLEHNIDGVIATNTTIDRESVAGHKHAEEAGGLSGLPVRQLSTQVISWLHEILGDRIPIIGVGGIDSAESAKEKLNAGAKLVQIYTGFIYQGPQLIKEIVNDL